MRNLLPWRTVASVVFAATALSAWAADTPKMQGSDNGTPSDSATPTTPRNTMTPDRSTPDERHSDADRNSGASPSPQDIGPRGVPGDALKHKWPNGSTATPGSKAEDQGTTDSQQAQPQAPASPFSPANPAAPALQDPQGGDPTNPVTPATMRYMILAQGQTLA